jgi:hypothetical protein
MKDYREDLALELTPAVNYVCCRFGFSRNLPEDVTQCGSNPSYCGSGVLTNDMGDLTPAVLDASRRPLTETERRVIRAKIRSLTATGRRASRVYLPIACGVVLVLWFLTLMASDAPWLVVTAFWLVVGGGITLWVRRDMRKHAGQLEGIARGLESALRRNAADVYDVRASSFAVLEEIEDEGACYVFQLEGDRLVFIAGQEFYEAARFPSHDFSLVYILDEHGRRVDMFIDKRGAKAAPARTIPAVVKRKLDVPAHLEVHIGRIENLENCIGPPSEQGW